MREESHLDDMRAAIRGDFERLQERLGDQLALLDGRPDGEEQFDHDEDQQQQVEHRILRQHRA